MEQSSKHAYKVPGGKLLKVELWQQKGRVVTVKITGDFFVHPEEALAQLEKGLEGCRLEEKEIESALEAKIRRLGCQIIGFGPKDAAMAIIAAANSKEQS